VGRVAHHRHEVAQALAAGHGDGIDTPRAQFRAEGGRVGLRQRPPVGLGVGDLGAALAQTGGQMIATTLATHDHHPPAANVL
jgi:hypothetical protein